MLPGEATEDTLHADLEAAFDGIASGDGGASTETVSEPVTEVAGKTGASETAPAAKTETAAADDRARGPDGKFVPKADVEVAPKASAKGAAGGGDKRSAAAPIPPIPSTDATKASTAAPSTAPDAPPVGWTADAKTEWQSLSPAIKAAVLKREVEMSAGGRQWSDEKRQYESVLAPVKAAASRKGMSATQGLQALLAAEEFLDRDFQGAIQWLAQSRGLTVTVNGKTDPINGQPAADVSSRIEPQYRDPRIDALWEHQQSQQRRETDMTVQKVSSFATDPAHPYFDALNTEIMALLPVLKSSNPQAPPEELLQSAYDSAVWANKETRAALQAQMAADAAATRRTTTAADVAKSRLAASSIRPGAPAGVPAAEPRESIREEILAAWGDAR